MPNGKVTKKTADNLPTFYSQEFLDRIKQFKTDMHKFYTEIGAEETPKLDGDGREIIKKRPDGYDYIIEGYMRKKLDQYFPGWSWEYTCPLQFLGVEWVVAEGNLVIIDEHLLAFGINPPVRKFHGVGAARIAFKSGMPHAQENIIDIDKNVKGSNGAAFKYSVNRLTNIGDDVYHKRIEEEGAGSLEEIMIATDEPINANAMFMKYIGDRHILVSKVLTILEVKSLEDIEDYQQAYKLLEEKLG